MVLNVHTVSQSGCHSFSNVIIVFSLQCSTICVLPLIILLFRFTFPFNNNINVHQSSQYTCLITCVTWYRFSNIKIYIAQGSGFLRLVNQIMIQKKTSFVWIFMNYLWLHCRYSILMRCNSCTEILFFLFFIRCLPDPKF